MHLAFFKELNQNHKVLWNDGPRLQALDKELQELGVAPRELGKGRNVKRKSRTKRSKKVNEKRSKKKER